MILTIDIGNTNILSGIYKDKELIFDFRLKTDISKTSDEYFLEYNNILKMKGLNLNSINKIAVSSVVSSLNKIISNAFEKYLNKSPYFIKYSNKLKSIIKLKIKYPEKLGADRLTNAEYCVNEFPGRNIIVIDFGTATTFDVINSNSEYVGGVIAPGVNLSAETLFKRASKLYSINYKRIPRNVVGKDTEECMLSGIMYGYSSLVEGLLEKIIVEQKFDDCKIIATGGLSELMKKLLTLRNILVDDYITLKGIKLLYEKNN
jgi:type III pantothenate kinase